MSLIPADNVFALGAILFCVAWLAFLIDTKPIGKKTSGVIWALGVSMLLSNTGIIPFSSPTYDFVGGSLVPLAIPLLLLKGDLRRIFRESGGVMIFFCIASMATVAGAVIGFYIMDLGEIGPKVAGVYTGGWIGGAVNVLAVSQAVEMTTQEFSVAISASSVVSMSALMLLIAIPSVGLIKRMVPTQVDKSARVLPIEPGQDETPTLQLTHISGALALSFIICALAQSIAQWLQLTQYSILFITVLTIAVANAFPGKMAGLKGDFELGMLLMYLFFVAVGAGTDAISFIASAFHLFVYGMLIIIIHLALVLFAARVMKVDMAEAIVASSAALVGPAVTAAIATSKGWKHLVTPGIMCGVFGYVIGTFIGVTVTAVLG
ncbi:MAG: DUF819 family protein [Gammaproteobacteria bacterium]|jgi:uncharacterized membrane protein|nr:DUF819 family protein [Gammaproteobacteria bacterium]MBT3867039.1 DUF819 family protein [Gammaproteobacteria bacterium]MBT4379390.1 DUF819 family protein [Gammaproteobacteria bacterium]MBT4615219.1 DUF819 family protein [Gammaproteobacteria bacterium]MBT5197372.1 DUF819 family protein [Gammaproteobacteria bacterium]